MKNNLQKNLIDLKLFGIHGPNKIFVFSHLMSEVGSLGRQVIREVGLNYVVIQVTFIAIKHFSSNIQKARKLRIYF